MKRRDAHIWPVCGLTAALDIAKHMPIGLDREGAFKSKFARNPLSTVCASLVLSTAGWPVLTRATLAARLFGGPLQC